MDTIKPEIGFDSYVNGDSDSFVRSPWSRIQKRMFMSESGFSKDDRKIVFFFIDISTKPTKEKDKYIIYRVGTINTMIGVH